MWTTVGSITNSKSGKGVNITINGDVYNVSRQKIEDLIDGTITSCMVKKWDTETPE